MEPDPDLEGDLLTDALLGDLAADGLSIEPAAKRIRSQAPRNPRTSSQRRGSAARGPRIPAIGTLGNDAQQADDFGQSAAETDIHDIPLPEVPVAGPAAPPRSQIRMEQWDSHLQLASPCIHSLP